MVTTWLSSGLSLRIRSVWATSWLLSWSLIIIVSLYFLIIVSYVSNSIGVSYLSTVLLTSKDSK
jgi:hypothetical protein